MRSAPLPLPKGQAGAAADIINTVWMLAATLGVAVLGVVFAARAGVSPVNAKRIVAGPHPAAFIGGALGELLGAFAGLATGAVKGASCRCAMQLPNAATG